MVAFEEPGFAEDNNIRIIPLQIHLGNQLLLDSIDINSEELFFQIQHSAQSFRVIPPPISSFEEAYKDLSKSTDQICVITHSQQFTQTYAHAQAARSGLLGRCEIVIIDSQSTSLGQGYLVETISRAAQEGSSIDDIVQIARNVVPRIYSVYYVNTLDYIQRAGLIGETQAILGAMLNIKPLLTIEDGKMIVMEKVRSHSQAIDKMVEFVAEFTHVERLGILQNTLRVVDRTRMLQDRLALEFSRTQYPVALYEPLTLSIIGPNAMGMVVLEGADDDGYE
jgi:DegV family protein with EDD domain